MKIFGKLFFFTKQSRVCYNTNIVYAGVAELADALDLGSSAFGVQVRLLSPAPVKNRSCGISSHSFFAIRNNMVYASVEQQAGTG